MRARLDGPFRAAAVLFLAVALWCQLGRAQARDGSAKGEGKGLVDVGAAPDVSAFVGRVITRIEVVVDGRAFRDVPAPRIHAVRAGETFTPEAARRALQEALGAGAFAEGRVILEREGSGVRLVVRVVPRKLVDDVRLTIKGASLDRDELLREADLAPGGEITDRSLAELESSFVRMLKERGYPLARVRVTVRGTDDPLRILLLVDVETGEPQQIAVRKFRLEGGDPAVLEQLDAYRIGKGTVVNGAALATADDDLEKHLRARGWHHAQVSHELEAISATQVSLRVLVDPGPKIVPRFEGNDHYDQDALLGALGLENETDRSPGNLERKLEDFYVRRGFLDVQVSTSERVHPKAPVRELVFRIVEGPSVTVVARAYPCLRELEIKTLKEGGPNSPAEIGDEIDSFLEDELPGADLLRDPHPVGLDKVIGQSNGARAIPLDLDPSSTYRSETYERAIEHVQELYRNEGFLHALVGPVQPVRRRCSPRSPPGACIPEPLQVPEEQCAYNAENLPVPSRDPDLALVCRPDPAKHVRCEPRLALRIPIKLGPRTSLYDLAFSGAHVFSEKDLAKATELVPGTPLSMLKLDEARRKLLDLYLEEGYAYAEVRYALEASADHTRARVRFEVLEGDQVMVRGIVLRGHVRTNPWVIRRRIALEVGGPYRASLVRKTQERIATLNVFSSVSVDLEDPYVPEKEKYVIITMTELTPGVLEPRAGFDTGEGIRGGFDFAYRNVAGEAVGFNLGAQVSYLPDPFILDPQVRENFRKNLGNRLDVRTAFRVTTSLVSPEIGLGPLVGTQLDALVVHDLQRDFYITKFSLAPGLNYRPASDLRFSIFQSFEYNNLRIFNAQNAQEYAAARELQGQPLSQDLIRYILVPGGPSFVVAQRLLVAWDRRDDAFDARRGTWLSLSVEHVDGYPQDIEARIAELLKSNNLEYHFVRFFPQFAGYIPFGKRVRLAGIVRAGLNLQLTDRSTTYPDRFFFMGGPDSMRGWYLSTFLPQDDVDRVFADRDKPDTLPDGTINRDKFTPASKPIRGGNLMLNPRVELRIPVRGPFETVIFSDVGNLWTDPGYPFKRGKFPIRASAGSGLRITTPVGPIALDVGFNLTREPFEEPWTPHLMIGLF